ncbi:MAG: hypothetical protein CMH27_00540 [Micavibrio sp.]|nr:hypothetical protein [Micavibrio sp.]|tara:strand:- start:1387 stop:2328 length:942 start_codon:yes stop_codon:yes gene_type:complete
MSVILNRIKNVIRYVSPFHNTNFVTHASLKKDYMVAKNKLCAEALSNIETLQKQLAGKGGHKINPNDGFLITQVKNKELLDKAVEYCKRAWPKDYIEKTVSKPSKANTLLPVHVDIRDARNKPVLDFALSEELIATAADYLGDVPVLYGAYVWYCPNREADDMVGSQLFHCDREDHRQLKVFIPIDEITAGCGPTTCVSAESTHKFFERRKNLGFVPSLKNRFTDEDVHAHASDKEHAIIGKPGTLGFVDTTNCLHYGSRPASDGKYHMVLHYLTPFSPKITDKLAKDVFLKSAEDIMLAYEDTSHYLRDPIS